MVLHQPSSPSFFAASMTLGPRRRQWAAANRAGSAIQECRPLFLKSEALEKISQRNSFLRQRDAFAVHGIKRERILRGLNRPRFLIANGMLGEERQEHITMFLVRLAMRLEIGNLFPGKSHLVHPFFCHARRLSAAQIAE